MTGLELGSISLLVMIVLIYMGMHVAIALASVSFVALWLYKGNVMLALSLSTLVTKDAIASYSFGVVPLFVLMGMFVNEAGLGRDIYTVAHSAFRKLNGGLGIATVAANAVFAAITGISIASAAIFTRIAVPEMMRYGHTARFSVGVVAGSSVLGMLIPPSVLLIVYGLIAEVSIADMFTAGILPGLVLAALYCIVILAMCRFMPGFTGQARVADDQPGLGLLASLRLLGPAILLIVLVLGGIYGGVFTPTEAGAAGAFAAMVIAAAKRRLSPRVLWRLASDTGRVTAAILFLIIAASMYSRMLGVLGIPSLLAEKLNGMEAGFAIVLLIYVALMIFLGTILDSTSIILLLVPLFIPAFATYDVNLVWLGVVTVIGVEIGLLTPPLGIACFVIKGALEDKSIGLKTIFVGALPFALTMGLALLIVILFPALTLSN
ncbi:C4-dicarboxylate ABC transporter permease (plasmid) [Pacificitalea manganoxidans]|uniref:TRAP transporter large permease protein n=1 Tax=Pacificitalea manganoxidans TaxID=1411902 RepID=A0A291M4E7_9RHOB|nr:TRAP transporter large permease [Pacificitalea manganoxidans]ATI43863.1 C4-dicarboxylate ABC transporter permease [Pacificitalea manganoxidans]MAQ45277.1 TRAP transporter large permease [Actibacterium sp.]MDR6310237.1 tripartite ATP-independent transporter DctM subunit [Pacificitalea manganoxidans]OWU67418.1 C4-dicarboxylate ABC transporter permease [Roseovarius sp. 22II1-1F6A]|tara:strand:- start:110 stop:1414 length:1305 start_codon:yes stop_codon:yes gene_type:complete